jgi:hypothetical protein
MPWIGVVLGRNTERAIPRSSKVSAHMTSRLLPPSTSTLERRFEPTIDSMMRGRSQDAGSYPVITLVEDDRDLHPLEVLQDGWLYHAHLMDA